MPKSIRCNRFAKHKSTLINPDILIANGIDVGMVSVQSLNVSHTMSFLTIFTFVVYIFRPSKKKAILLLHSTTPIMKVSIMDSPARRPPISLYHHGSRFFDQPHFARASKPFFVLYLVSVLCVHRLHLYLVW